MVSNIPHSAWAQRWNVTGTIMDYVPIPIPDNVREPENTDKLKIVFWVQGVFAGIIMIIQDHHGDEGLAKTQIQHY